MGTGLIRPAHGFPRRASGWQRRPPRAWRCRQPGRAWLAAVDQVYGFRVAIHLLEPPLTEMPGRSQVHEQPAPAAAPNGARATRHCAGLRAKPQGTAEARVDGGHGRKASGASAPWRSQRRASGAPGDQRRQAADISSANGFLGTAGSGPAARPVQGPGLQGQVTTATPVRSRRARARSPSGACSGHRAPRQRQRPCGHCHHQAPPKACACVGVDVPGEAALCPARRRRRCDARG